MLEALLEPFELVFVQRALVAGLLVAVTTSLIGTWVVLRGLTFLGDALAHGVVPGIAAAQLLGVPVVVGAGLSVVVMVAGIELVRRTSRLADDVGIGLLFVGMLSLGVVIVSRSSAFSTDLTALLFGDILGVGTDDVRGQLAAAAIVVLGAVVLYRPFLALAVDETKAELLGMRPRLAHLAMLALVSMAVVASFRAVGTLLVFGLMVAPPATAVLLVRRVPWVMVTSLLLGSLSVVIGLELSYHYDTAAAASMSGAAVAQFLVVAIGRTLADSRQRSVHGEFG
jgi:ABC-type Mn2+/Zn2+ transport system permease subunit